MDQTPPTPARHRPIQDWLAPRLLAGLILAACLGVTAIAWYGARVDTERQLQADFDARVREQVNLIALRMQTYIQVLYGVQGLFVSSAEVGRKEFRDYLAVQQVEAHFPGIQGIGFMRMVLPGQREAHEAAVRADGLAGYAITPPGARELYAPVAYLEPSSQHNLRALGYDAYTEPLRRAALDSARDSGQAAMTGKLRLVQGGQGFLIVLPVYDNALAHDTLARRRGAIRGWVFAPFRMDELMTGLGGDQAALLDMAIYDGDSLAGADRMFGAGAAPGLRPAARQIIRVAGHSWTALIVARPGFDQALADKPGLIAAAGIGLSLGLAALTWLLARSRARVRQALLRARRLTRELHAGRSSLLAMADTAQRSQAMLRGIVDATVDGILVDSPDGKIVSANRRFHELWQVPVALDWQQDGGALFRHLEDLLEQAAPLLHGRAQAACGSGERRDVLRLKDGRVFEQFIRGIQLGNEQARLWSFRDITEAHQVEQRERTRRHVLELLASGAPLAAVLEGVVLGVEAGNAAMLCSILLLAEDGSLQLGAAPSLPAFFRAAMHGMPASAQRGCCGAVVSGGRRVIAADIGRDPLWRPQRGLAARARLGACWSEPVRGASGKLLGAFAIYLRQPARPGRAELALMEEAAHLAGIAIEQSQAAIALRAGEARFRSLYDNAPVALWEQDWSAVRAALAELERAGVDDLAAYLRANPSQLRYLAGLVRILDVNGAALAQVGAPGDKRIGTLSLAQNFDDGAMPGFAAALAALARGDHFFACESSFRRLDGVARQNELTLLVMPGHEHSLDFVIVSTLDITERKRMNEELLQLATTDFLTGLPNRRQFMARLDGEHARLQRGVDQCAAVLMLDLDHFKLINDEHGHAGGDAVLRHVAGLMRDSQRRIDTLGRVGGEEFAILLPATDLAAAGVFAERLRQRIGAAPLQLDGAAIGVTVSIGIAAMEAGDAAFDSVLSRADKALYRAKHGGRNRAEYAAGADEVVQLSQA